MSYRKTVTLSDIASLMGLSVNTVSKALRGLPGMSEKTRHAVIEFAEKNGYRTKAQELGLAVEHIPVISRKPMRFAFIGNQSHNSTQRTLIRNGIEEKLSEFGHTLELVEAKRVRQLSAFREWVERSNLLFYDGVFIPPLIDSGLEEFLMNYRLPRILINFPPSIAKVDSVIWDVKMAIHQSVNFLREMGHQQILYIGDSETHRGFRLRWQAFQDAMRDFGLDPRLDWHIVGRITDKQQMFQEIIHRLRKYKPTAILCAIYSDLNLVKEACGEAGVNIPDDCSLVGLRYDETVSPTALSGPILPIKEAGVRAAERMLWRLANPQRPIEHTSLQTGQICTGRTVCSPSKIS